MTSTAFRLALFLGLVLGGCGDSSTGSADARPVDAAAGSPDAAAPMLTVKNYLSWCSVSVGGAATSTAATQTVAASTAADVTLVATAASASFILGDWHHTDGDTSGAGDPGTVSGSMTTAKVMVSGTASKCVWICCPFTNGTGCPTADQCP
jgi:hypothetical protein